MLNFRRNTFSRFSNCRIFFFPSSISAVNSSQVFSLGFVMVGCSFLPVGIEKGQSIFSAALVKWKTYLLCKKVLFGYFFIRSMACLGVGHISLSFRQSLCYDSVHITSIFPQTQRQCYRRTDKPQPLQYHHLPGNFLLVLPKN